MKRILMGTMIGIGLATLISGCGSSGNSANSSATVDLLGSWNYAVFTKNSVCDGKLAQGTEIIESLNGDTTKVGDIILQGTNFSLDGNQNCYLTSINQILTRAQGAKSSGTKQDFISFNNKLTAGDNTIKSYTITSFSQLKITSVTKYKNGVEITSQLTR